MKKVCMILEGHFHIDKRVQKELLALKSREYEIHVLCFSCKGMPKFEKVDGVYVYRFINYRINLFKIIVKLFESTFFINPYYLWHLNMILRKQKINVVHIHDLPLFKTAFMLKKKYNLSLIIDFHENYANALQVWISSEKGISRYVKSKLFEFSKWERYERFAYKYSDFQIFTVEEMRERFISKYDKSNGLSIVFRNTQDISFLDQVVDKNIIKFWKNKFILLYIGGIGDSSGLDVAIKAMQYLDDNIKLLIVGSGSKNYIEYIYELIPKLSLEDKVKCIGKKPFNTMLSYIKISKIGLLPHHNNGNNNYASSHKMFQYMLGGLPVLSSNTTSFNRVVNESQDIAR